MTDNERYNGWANWATWVVVLWARNDEENYWLWRDLATALKDHPDELAKFLRDNYTDLFINDDLPEADFPNVDWDEVAAAAIEDVA